MKKLMIAAAIVCAAAMSQAGTFNWTVASQFKEVDFSRVTDNGMYAADGAAITTMGPTVYTAVLSLYKDGDLIGQSVPTVVQVGLMGLNYLAAPVVDEAVAGTTYDYTLVVKGAPTALTGKTSDDYDYSNAYVQWSVSDSITAEMGSQNLPSTAISSWEVMGVEPKGIPEPTSGLLLLLGVAGLALKRKRA